MSDRDSDEIQSRSRGESIFSNPDSYVHSRHASVFTTSQMDFAKVSQENDSRLYKSQSQCFICETSLGKASFSNAKKFGCQFCYNAVCGNCSPLTCAHPTTRKPERICMNCYNTFIEEKAYKKVSNDLRAILDKETEARITEVTQRKLFEAKCQVLQQDLEEKEIEFQESIKEKDMMIKDLESKCTEMESIIKNSKSEANTITDHINLINVDLENSEDAEQHMISKIKAENEELKRKIQILQTAPKASTCGCMII